MTTTTIPDAILTTHDLTIGYPGGRRQPDVVIAEHVNLNLHRGELVCLLGPNGAGKSTLLRTLSGMQPPLVGEARLLGDEVSHLDARELARRMSIVLTERVSVGSLTAYALVALGRHPYTNWTGGLTAADEAIVRWAIEAVNARDLAGRSVNELSDGERQKIMIARALAQQPAVMLLDEPTAFLDLPHRIEIMHILRGLARDCGQAVLLSTHDLDLALRTADRIWLLAPDGRFTAGAPEDLVLNGAFERTFARSGLTFNQETGGFMLHTSAAPPVALDGEGPTALWTRRALERAGFQVQATPIDGIPSVTIQQAEPTTWQCRRDGRTAIFDALYDVVQYLSAP